MRKNCHRLITRHCFYAPAAAVVPAVIVCGVPGGSGCGLSAASFQVSLKSPTACVISPLISSVSDFFSRMALSMPGCDDEEAVLPHRRVVRSELLVPAD